MPDLDQNTFTRVMETPPSTASLDASSYVARNQPVLTSEYQIDSNHGETTRHGLLHEQKPMFRKRRTLGTELAKHRRTRNGCYTCRSRRVKCDEVHPICERCRKGSRECTYPEPRTVTKSSREGRKDHTRAAADDSRSSSSSDVPDSQGIPKVKRRPPNSKAQPTPTNAKFTELDPKKRSSSSSRLDSTGSPQLSIEQVSNDCYSSPSTEVSSAVVSSSLESGKFSSTDFSRDESLAPPWAQLPLDIQFYLDYHKSHLTSHHYFFKHDATYFVHTTLIQHALRYEPLLYAVVAFAAFQFTVGQSKGKIQDFLAYYNNSVSLLRKSLSGGEKHTEATMMAILQLATFEDYLGDWVSLLSHQKAACGMLLELYTPESITNNEVQRKILMWYTKFDVMSGLSSGYETILSREWFDSTEKYYIEQSAAYPGSIDQKIEAAVARMKLLGADMSALFARFSRGSVKREDFIFRTNHFATQIRTWRESLDSVFRDDRYLVTSFEGRKKDSEDIVDPYQPGGLYDQPLFTFNFMLIDWHSFNLVQKYKTALFLNQAPPLEIKDHALEICRIYEAIKCWPRSPPGAFMKAQGALGLAIVFLPKDEKHINWCRRQLAYVETKGHIYPASFRIQMAKIWGIPDLKKWWLSDESVCPSVVRNIHEFMEDRIPLAEGQTRDDDQRNIKGIFSNLSISEKRS